MSFDDVTVSLIDHGPAREAVANGPTAVAGKFTANVTAIRERVLALKKDRDQAQARFASIEQRLDEAKQEVATTSAQHEREIGLARAMLAALESHCTTLESRLSNTRRELGREKAYVESLRARLRGLARRGPTAS